MDDILQLIACFIAAFLFVAFVTSYVMLFLTVMRTNDLVEQSVDMWNKLSKEKEPEEHDHPTA